MAASFPELEDLKAGVIAATAVTAELMLAGRAETGSAWAPVNAVAPLLLTPEAAEAKEFHPRYSCAGLGILVGGIWGWTVLHRWSLRLARGSGIPCPDWESAVVSATTLAVFDYRLLPPERRPRFSRWLSTPAIIAKYAVLAAVLGAIPAGGEAPSLLADEPDPDVKGSSRGAAGRGGLPGATNG